ncbi:stalk domain-containing protein [Paenibacillus apiarius]|uniref:stalk domain-containing protein n=1 Tax=Paenibacillus apiarius TaxID=46240 RepID=UPI001F094124|nr:stalk domain-containing protein [Paenibacillus apiarius]MEC0117970.1 stalk domain-containing protein [Paenibacillus apiarius]MEC0190254.1 stalk domain-containing protein [Paenibacillus apiarius]
MEHVSYHKTSTIESVCKYQINGSAYAPVRAVAEAAGATVRWDGKERKAVIDKHA